MDEANLEREVQELLALPQKLAIARLRKLLGQVTPVVGRRLQQRYIAAAWNTPLKIEPKRSKRQ